MVLVQEWRNTCGCVVCVLCVRVLDSVHVHNTTHHWLRREHVYVGAELRSVSLDPLTACALEHVGAVFLVHFAALPCDDFVPAQRRSRLL